MSEIDRLKAENEKLKKKNVDLQEYADFKRDLNKFKSQLKDWRNWAHWRHWRNWLKFGPLAGAFLYFMVVEPFTGESNRRFERMINNTNSDIYLAIMFAVLSVGVLAILWRGTSWWLKRRKRLQ